MVITVVFRYTKCGTVADTVYNIVIYLEKSYPQLKTGDIKEVETE